MVEVNMKSIFNLILVAAAMTVFPAGGWTGNPQAGKVKFDVIQLSAPDLAKGKSVMQALKNRKSERGFSARKLSHTHLSELLWAANGVNRKDGKRTAPAALDIQAVDIYVVMPEGVYLYDAVGNLLLPIIEGDFRPQTGDQDFVRIAPVNLVYVADLAKLKKLPGFAGSIPDEVKLNWSYIAAGCQSQNVYLYCASEGLCAVMRGSIDKEKFGKSLKLRPDQTVLSAQTVGYPK
jgi:nitroreductase